MPADAPLHIAVDANVLEADWGGIPKYVSRVVAELVAHGDVVATQPANGQDRVALRQDLVADRSMWIAVRAYGGNR